MSIKHIDELSERDFIVDVHLSFETNQGMIPNAINSPLDELRDNLADLPRNKTIHIYCTIGLRSYIASRILTQNGFTVKNLSGDYYTYVAHQQPELLSSQIQSLQEAFSNKAEASL